MKILFASSEVEPFSKTGGLADVAGALPVALSNMGHDVLVVTPKYKTLNRPIERQTHVVRVPLGKNIHSAELYSGVTLSRSTEEKTPVVLIGSSDFFDRDQLYATVDGDYPDNHLRFAFFSRAIIEVARALSFRPDIIHINDWQTALMPVYLKTMLSSDSFFAETKTLLTIHNLGYQGLFDADVLEEIGLPESIFNMDGIEYFGKVNFLKGGIMFSEAVNTVSKKYAEEIQTLDYGVGFDGIMRSISHRLFGILNGVDYSVWNPSTDEHIVANYSPADMSYKEKCKSDLLSEFGMPYKPGRPLVGMISRLTVQKGFDLIEEALDDLMIRDMQIVILGTGERKYHDFLESVADRYPDRLGIQLAYDNTLAHKIEAGCDMFLMPSRYEPCGLNQMYSLKYGTVPIVRATGGLDDTIRDWNHEENGNGFKFASYDKNSMLDALDRALKAFLDEQTWSKIVATGMAEDYSWDASARQYTDLYNKIMHF